MAYDELTESSLQNGNQIEIWYVSTKISGTTVRRWHEQLHVQHTPTPANYYCGTNIMDEIDVTVGINLRRDEQRTRSLPSKDPICYVPLSEPNANIQITAIGYSRSTSCVAKIVSQSLIIFIMLKYTQQNHCYLNQTNQTNNFPWECLFYIHIKWSGLVNLISRWQQ